MNHSDKCGQAHAARKVDYVPQHPFVGVSPCPEGTASVLLAGRSHAPLAIHRVTFAPAFGSLRRLAGYARVVEEICAGLAGHGPPALVAIKGYNMPVMRTAQVLLVELGLLLRLRMAQAGWQVVEIPPGTLRKFTVGEGQAGPDMVAAALSRTYGQMFYTHAEAEAYGLAQAARCLIRGGDYPAFRRELLARGVCLVPMAERTDWPGPPQIKNTPGAIR